MKILKKLSLVYTLQIFAVVLLSGHAVATPLNKKKNTKEPATNGIKPSKLNTQPLGVTNVNSILTGKTNDLWQVHAAKSP